MAAAAPDVTLLVNNADIATRANLLTGDLDTIRLELDTHFLGTFGVIRTFAPSRIERRGSNREHPVGTVMGRV